MGNCVYDVAVVGAGVFGAWTAYQLQRSGKRVALIDAYGAGNSRSSSGDESRIIRMGYGGDEIYTRSAWNSLDLWKELFARTGENLFHQTGVLWLEHESDPYPAKTFETLKKLGIPIEKLSLAETSARYAQISTEGLCGAYLEPESGVLVARRAVQAVVREAIKSGVEYFEEAVSATGVPPVTHAQDARATDSPVIHAQDARATNSPVTHAQDARATNQPVIHAQDARATDSLDSLITSSGQRIAAGAYVFACGPWLPKLCPALLAHRIHPTRQEVFYFGATAGTRFKPPALPTWIDFKDEAYGLPDVEGRGVKVAIDRHGEPFDPDTGDRVASSKALVEVRRYLARRVPELKDAPVNESRVCQYENTSNGDFLIDRHPEFENVWLVGGGSGHGFKHGPSVGEYVAARIAGRPQGIESRFSLTSKATQQQRAVF
jgi:glycine/D-amino acid oxidase-like deaminating enzyme